MRPYRAGGPALLRALPIAPLIALLIALAGCSGGDYDPQPSGELTPLPGPVPAGRLTARFFGVSTLLFSDGRSAVMTDGFFSRPGLLKGLLQPLQPDIGAVRWALEQGEVGKLDAVLVPHSHFDHALDSATVAKETGATVVGSLSTCRIVRAEKLARDRTGLVAGGERFKVGTFDVRVFKGEHTPPPPFPIPALDGDVDPGFTPPARIFDYEQGGTYSFLIEHDGHAVLVNSSTNYRKGLYDGVRADVVFLGVALLARQGPAFARTYWHEVVEKTGAKLVIPVHWDDYTRSLQEKPLKWFGWPDDPPADMKVVRELAARSGVRVAFMPLFKPVDILAEARVDPTERRALPPPAVVRPPPTCPF
jgi:L-ascorbate metabolism protein UlaG (beta-lactamase superfamily)